MHTDKKLPAGSVNYPAGHTDRAILPRAWSRFKLAMLALAVIFGGLR